MLYYCGIALFFKGEWKDHFTFVDDEVETRIIHQRYLIQAGYQVGGPY